MGRVWGERERRKERATETNLDGPPRPRGDEEEEGFEEESRKTPRIPETIPTATIDASPCLGTGPKPRDRTDAGDLALVSSLRLAPSHTHNHASSPPEAKTGVLREAVPAGASATAQTGP